jgi:hypothetical protein
VIAVEQQRIDRCSDLAFRGFDQRQPEIARTELDTEHVARQAAVRRQHDDPARVRELLRLLVPRIPETRCPRQALDGRSIRGQEV